jgi:hypothetical protein
VRPEGGAHSGRVSDASPIAVSPTAVAPHETGASSPPSLFGKDRNVFELEWFTVWVATLQRGKCAVARVAWWWHTPLVSDPVRKQPRAPAHRLPEGCVPEDEAVLAEAKLSQTESDAVRAWLRGEASEPCLDKPEPSD